MSYSRSYTGYVHYSGTVSYPASQHGGSVSYSGSEQVNITINVDTDAFDTSVDRCNNAVIGLNTAVVATEAAQVESKQRTSRQIASAIVNGFFEYVTADLSQKIKELASKCESLFIALTGHKECCLSKSKQMQDDYNRISKRYSKIFEDLDKETISRIEVLDKPAFQFAEQVQKVIDRNSDTNLLGISTISANENLQIEAILSCSHVKQQANTLLDKANKYLQGNYRLTNAVRDMLDDTKNEENILLPVMYVETVASPTGKESKIYGTNDEFTPSGRSVDSKLTAKFMSREVEWSDMDPDILDKVISYLNSAITSEQIDDRTLKTMLGLLNNRAIQTIKA